MKYILPFFIFCAFLVFPRISAAELNTDLSNFDMGMPMLGGGTEEANVDICPTGASVVASFIEAWNNEDYETMYELIDDESKKDYTFKEAAFDFRMVPAKEYKISSVHKVGENYEFILGYGSWKDGDKENKKMIISGKSFKIIMPSRGVFFKTSAADYF